VAGRNQGRHRRGRRRLRRGSRRTCCRLRRPAGNRCGRRWRSLRRWCDRCDRIGPQRWGVAVAGLLWRLDLGSLGLALARGVRTLGSALVFGVVLGPVFLHRLALWGFIPGGVGLACIGFRQLFAPGLPLLLSRCLAADLRPSGPRSLVREQEPDLPQQVWRRQAPLTGAPAAWRCGPDAGARLAAEAPRRHPASRPVAAAFQASVCLAAARGDVACGRAGRAALPDRPAWPPASHPCPAWAECRHSAYRPPHWMSERR